MIKNKELRKISKLPTKIHPKAIRVATKSKRGVLDSYLPFAMFCVLWVKKAGFVKILKKGSKINTSKEWLG